jgi:hypothetical protein
VLHHKVCGVVCGLYHTTTLWCFATNLFVVLHHQPTLWCFTTKFLVFDHKPTLPRFTTKFVGVSPQHRLWCFGRKFVVFHHNVCGAWPLDQFVVSHRVVCGTEPQTDFTAFHHKPTSSCLLHHKVFGVSPQSQFVVFHHKVCGAAPQRLWCCTTKALCGVSPHNYVVGLSTANFVVLRRQFTLRRFGRTFVVSPQTQFVVVRQNVCGVPPQTT